MLKRVPFVGRKDELGRLRRVAESPVAGLVVLRGRRRIGKTRLAEEFAKGYRTVFLTGLPPTEGLSPLMQREHIASQMARALEIPTPRADDWNVLFWTLAHHTREGKVLVVFDEVSWLGQGDPTFLGKLKTAWDSDFKKNPELLMMLTGSVSSWIEKNILSSTGFVGRISLELHLEELPLSSCGAFWGKERVSPYEKFKFLAVSGGVPRYLEEMHPSLSAEENIRRLCFEQGGLLVKEFERIFADLFHQRGGIYKKIVNCLTEGPADLRFFRQILDVQKGGKLSEYLDDLESAGFVSQDQTWHIKTKEASKLRSYRLRDNYLRFYLKYIAANRSQIEKGRYKINPAQWPAIFGLQFENLVLNNRNRILELLYIDPQDVVSDGPYFQRHTKRQQGCQVDYLIQTRDNTLYVCEIKFSRYPVLYEVIPQVERKMRAITPAKGFSVRPILLHVNGVSDEVLASEFFSRILDFGQLFES